MVELVTDYLENALPWTARFGVRWHLLQCKACTLYFDQFRRTVTLLADAPPPRGADPVSEAAADRLVSRLRSGANPQAGDN